MLTGTREALRMWKRARYVKKHGFTQLSGSPEQICRTIIDQAYKKHGFFPVSLGHFSEFYVRDFSWCAEALVNLGYKDEVRATLQYALKHFLQAGKITTIITPNGKAYDFPSYGPDTLALFLYTITHTKNETLVEKNKAFFQKQVDVFVKKFVDKNYLPKKGRFTSMRDHAKRKQSCYDATMIALVAKECETLGLRFPETFEKIQQTIKETYWNGTYFFSDIQKQNIVIGDANVFSFWTGVFTDKKMIEQACHAIQAAKLDEHVPLRYVNTIDKKRENVNWHIASWFTPDYETDSIWVHLGMAYIRVLATIDKEKAKQHLQAYTEKIKKHKTFLEVYSNDGEPYESPFYVTDEGIVWCASYLAIKKSV